MSDWVNKTLLWGSTGCLLFGIGADLATVGQGLWFGQPMTTTLGSLGVAVSVWVLVLVHLKTALVAKQIAKAVAEIQVSDVELKKHAAELEMAQEMVRAVQSGEAAIHGSVSKPQFRH